MLIEIAQHNLGVASLVTTTVYLTTEKRRWLSAVQTFWRTVRTVEKGAE